MIKNPEVKYQGQPTRGYVFQKHSGKYFTQVQKHTSSPPILSPSKSKQFVNPIKSTHQYKSLKAQAEYIQKIHQIKKRLETQIKKYKKQNNEINQSNKRSKIHVEQAKTLNLQQICLGLRRQRYKSEQQNPQIRFQTPTHKKLNRKSTVKFLLKNRAWIRKNLKTQQQSFLIRHRKSISQNVKQISPLNKNVNYFKSIDPQNKFNFIKIRDQNQKQFKFPSLERIQNKTQNYKLASNRAEVRYSLQLPKKQDIMLQKLQKNLYNISPQKESNSNRLSPQNSNRSSISKSKIKKMGILQLQGQTKCIEKRNQNRRKILLQKMQQNQSQIFLKGWEGHNERYHPYNESLGGQFYEISK